MYVFLFSYGIRSIERTLIHFLFNCKSSIRFCFEVEMSKPFPFTQPLFSLTVSPRRALLLVKVTAEMNSYIVS